MGSIEKDFEILGLKPGATLEEVERAYKDMAQVWHPDRFPNNPGLRQKAEEKMREINLAYQRIRAYLSKTGAKSPSSTGRNPEKIAQLLELSPWGWTDKQGFTKAGKNDNQFNPRGGFARTWWILFTISEEVWHFE